MLGEAARYRYAVSSFTDAGVESAKSAEVSAPGAGGGVSAGGDADAIGGRGRAIEAAVETAPWGMQSRPSPTRANRRQPAKAGFAEK